MHITTLDIPGLFLITPTPRADVRGVFQKTFDAALFATHGMKTDLHEVFETESHKEVIRGMHFQMPPHACAKYVSVKHGSILDVVLDIRMNSPTFGKHLSIQLSAENQSTLYIPEGFAHGFKALTELAHTSYLQTAGFNAACDAGIHFDSFGMDWGVDNPIMSERDKALPAFTSFISPFSHQE